MSGRFRRASELFDENTMRNAVLQVVRQRNSIRGVARECGLSYATLRKYVIKYYNTDKKSRKSIRYFPNYEVNQIYSKELENTLEKYLLVARKLHYGLTSETIKRMSYDLAIKNNLKVPKSWRENRMAGKHWLYGYLRRHPVILDILSWSRKFRPPIKNQFNTTVEIANPVEEITLSEKDIDKYVIEELSATYDETVLDKDSRLACVKSVVEESISPPVELALENSQPSYVESNFDDSVPSFVEPVDQNFKLYQREPVIINVIRKQKNMC